jgi:pSer/pThr/pTyr-binding forkhead associated (FHA) protein
MLTPPTSPLSPRTQRHATVRLPMPPPGRFLAIEHGPELLLLPIAGGVTTIGRSPTADIELDDHRVAARHAAVIVRGERVVVLGRGAEVGVNGRRVDEAELTDGDRITIGAARLIYIDHTVATPRPAASAPPASSGS